MCSQAEETMSHLLDCCPFAAAIWDKGAIGFRRSDRQRAQPARTLTDSNHETFKNRIIRTIWNSLPGMIMWCIWKERNVRIFRDKHNCIEKVWHMVRDNLLSSIRSMQWHDEDKLIPADEVHIREFWGVDKTQLDGIHKHDRILQPSSPTYWSRPPP